MPSFEIYAEPSHRLWEARFLDTMQLPDGVIVSRHKNSRGVFFMCDDASDMKATSEMLDEHGIAWQDNSNMSFEEWIAEHGDE
jgi:hypothetical protein